MNDAVVQPQCPVGMGRHVVVVRDEQDRHAVNFAQPLEEAEDVLAGDGVERAGRFVRE